MKKTPFDHLIAGDAKEGAGKARRRKPWLDQRQQFEEDVVECLLNRYELADTKTRYYLLEERKRFFSNVVSSGAVPNQRAVRLNMLTLGAFNAFFSAFPVDLFAEYLHRTSVARTTIPRLLFNFERTPMGRSFFDSSEEGRPADRPRAVVFKWPHVSISDSPTVHDCFPVNVRVPGMHALWTRANGDKWCVLESLETLLGTIDTEDPEHEWLISAKQADFLEPWGKKVQGDRRGSPRTSE